jgi:hypothetical protein
MKKESSQVDVDDVAVEVSRAGLVKMKMAWNGLET